MSSFVERAVRDVARLVVPLSCAGCGTVDVRVCAGCAARLAERPSRVEQGAPRLDRMTGPPAWPVWSVTAYTGVVRDLVVSWKDRGRVDLDRWLAAAVARLARTVAHDVLGEVPAAARVWVVPVPSTAAARRRRGREPVVDLARAVAREVARARAHPGAARVRLVRPLEHRRRLGAGALDQVGLGSRARGGNLAGAVRLRRGAPPLRGVACILVDDVLTTGATLVECERVIVAAGGTVVAGLVLAATPAPSSYPPGALSMTVR